MRLACAVLAADHCGHGVASTSSRFIAIVRTSPPSGRRPRTTSWPSFTSWAGARSQLELPAQAAVSVDHEARIRLCTGRSPTSRAARQVHLSSPVRSTRRLHERTACHTCCRRRTPGREDPPAEARHRIRNLARAICSRRDPMRTRGRRQVGFAATLWLVRRRATEQTQRPGQGQRAPRCTTAALGCAPGGATARRAPRSETARRACPLVSSSDRHRARIVDHDSVSCSGRLAYRMGATTAC